MRLIFLDVDYVLNSYRKSKEVYMLTGKRHSGKDFPFDEECMKYLKYIIDETNSYIVISSSWRKYNDHMEVLKDKLIQYNLFDRVIAMTNISCNKESEIKDFLNGISCNFVILDDSYMNELNGYLVRTDPYCGLTRENAYEAIRLLKR